MLAECFNSGCQNQYVNLCEMIYVLHVQFALKCIRHSMLLSLFQQKLNYKRNGKKKIKHFQSQAVYG